MKLTIILLSIAIVTITLFSLLELGNQNIITAFAIDEPKSFLTYNNSKLNLSIQYPSNWEITERKYNPDMKNISSTIEIKSPFEGGQDMVQEQFLISLNRLQKNITFNEYVNNALDQFKNEYRDFKLISNNSIIIDNHNARKVSYSYIAGVDPLSIKLIMNHNIISDGNKVYVLSFGTPPDKYYDYINIIQKMLNSFKILK
ncbi:MAG: PsbP-related protein [Deltaproteobacteria bacterium]